MYRIGAVTKTNGLQKHIHIKRERDKERGVQTGGRRLQKLKLLLLLCQSWLQKLMLVEP